MLPLRRFLAITLLISSCILIPAPKANAVVWVVVKAAIKKVIKAMDLQVQRLQNKTIWLQNAQKTLENSLSKLKLDEITDWVQKNKDQYETYFNELKKVREVIAGYGRVKEIIQQQVAIVNEYKTVFLKLRNDSHLTADEIAYMDKVYTGIISESAKNLDQLFLIVRTGTEMTDGKRLEQINAVGNRISKNLNDLRMFNSENKMRVLQKAKSKADINILRSLYDIH